VDVGEDHDLHAASSMLRTPHHQPARNTITSTGPRR
jgi:hypothetical protein